MKNQARSHLSRSALAGCAAFSVVVAGLWLFPPFWYSRIAPPGSFVWLGEKTHVEGWQFKEKPITGLAVSMLATDRNLNGEFTSDQGSQLVRVFSAKRYEGGRDQESLLRHTPDACWTGVGWKMLPLEPQFLTCPVHGLAFSFERRLFEFQGQKELVYFGAMMGGKPLPFRANHYQGGGQAFSRGHRGLSAWVRETRYWGLALDAFRNRTAFGGPQQFVRISTPVASDDLAPADALLQRFLSLWLQPVDYQQECAAWEADRAQQQQSGTGTNSAGPKAH